jgi:hypothetical protein
MTSNNAALVLAAMTDRRLSSIVARLPPEPRRGRPWSRPLRQRVLVACAALRTNLTMREPRRLLRDLEVHGAPDRLDADAAARGPRRQSSPV